MKTIKKFAAVALSLTLGLTALTGCGAKKTEVKTIGISFDPNVTQANSSSPSATWSINFWKMRIAEATLSSKGTSIDFISNEAFFDSQTLPTSAFK